MFLLFFCALSNAQNHSSYFASQLNYSYNQKANRIDVDVKYWRLCNQSKSDLVQKVTITSSNQGFFSLNLNTTISDVSFMKARFTGVKCTLENADNAVKGLEEFSGKASFSLDTLPFKKWRDSGVCEVVFSADFGLRDASITTGVANAKHYNYCVINTCNLLKIKKDSYRSIDYLYPPYTESQALNNATSVDFGAYGNGLDSLYFKLQCPVNGPKVSDILTLTSPLTCSIPITPFCPFGSFNSCSPSPQLTPPIGFYIDPKTSFMYYTPISSVNENGTVVIEGAQFAKDSLGNSFFIGLNRREFNVLINPPILYNNNPTLFGYNTDFIVTEGDTISFEIVSQDKRRILPPPEPSPVADTTFFVIRSNHKNLQWQIKDSSKRERSVVVNFKAKLQDAEQSPIVVAAIVYDKDSSLNARNMRSYRIWARKKLNIGLQVTKYNCGNVGLKLNMDSAAYVLYKTSPGSALLSGDQLHKWIKLDTAEVLVSLPENGIYNYTFSNPDNRFFGYQIADTFHYQKELIRLNRTGLNYAHCQSNTSKVIVPKIDFGKEWLLNYDWKIGTKSLSADGFWQIDTFGKVLLRVNTAQCFDTLTYFINPFNYGKRRNMGENIISSICDTVAILPYFIVNNSIDSIFIAQKGGNDGNLLANTFQYLACNAFPIDTANKLFYLYQRHKQTGCLITDTLNLTFLTAPFHFRSDSFCENTSPIDLTLLGSNPIAVRQSGGSFMLFDSNRMNITSKLDIENTGSNSNITYLPIAGQSVGKYLVKHHYQFGLQTASDSFYIWIKSNPAILLKKQLDSICAYAAYDLTQFIAVTKEIELYKINDVLFKGMQLDYINNGKFSTYKNAGTYTFKSNITHANGCSNDTIFKLVLNPLPVFSLGADIILATSGSRIKLEALDGMKQYIWNVSDVNSRFLDTPASDLNFKQGINKISCKVIDSNGCDYSNLVLIEYTTAVKSLTEETFLVFPNPVNSDFFSIKSELIIERVSIYNTLGKKMLSINGKGLKQMELLVSDLSGGEYLLIIETAKNHSIKKLSIIK